MISRRNIRVKVMQTLYTASTLENDPAANDQQKILQQHFVQTKNLIVYLTFFLSEVTKYAEKDSRVRSSRHLPSYADLHVNTKIAGNSVLSKLLEDASYKKTFAEVKPLAFADTELIKKIYLNLANTEAYKKYISNPERIAQEEKDVLEFILEKLMLGNDIFLSHIDETFSNWNDDGEMVIQLLDAFIKRPGHANFSEVISPDKKEFAVTLLKTVNEKKGYLQSLIIPKLKNWDPERIALLDMILMEMGVAEFLYFETIPPKVTINEYIDLAKEYSTAQSGQFVNGILDSIHKDLVQQGKMLKTEFKKA